MVGDLHVVRLRGRHARRRRRYRTRIGGEAEDIDIHVEKGRVRESDLWVHFAVPPRNAWDCVHHFCATVLAFRSGNSRNRRRFLRCP
jgi:hypothetical protein